VPDCYRFAERVNQAVPGAEHVVLRGLGHLANLEDPALFDATVLDFLERSSAG
jgi:pimeloyl-ACP methyl ester carboxylesterase